MGEEGIYVAQNSVNRTLSIQREFSKDCSLRFEYKENNCSEKYFQIILYMLNLLLGGRGAINDIYFPIVEILKAYVISNMHKIYNFIVKN